MKKRVTSDFQLKLMFLVGICLRLYYIVATPVIQSRQYDLGSAVPAEGVFTGHLGYIYYLFTYKGLPDFDPREVYQFFHPPLHHLISALWLELVSRITQNPAIWLMEWLQVLPFVYSVLTMVVIWQICKEFGLKDRALQVVMAIVIFHPNLIFMAGSINNDCLALLFQFLTIWMALRWFRMRNYWNILGIALSISLGMLTKLSVGMFAIPVAFLFLYVLIMEWRANCKDCAEQNTWKNLPYTRILQYVVFGIVCVPIGMAWAVRCLIRFGMPLTYVNHLPEQSWQYVGNYSLWQRFFVPNPIGLLKNLAHGSLGYGENVWMQLFRTAALGECDLSEFPLWGKFVALLMIAVAFLVALLAFVSFVRVFVLGRREQFQSLDMGVRIFWILGYVVLFVSYLNFCYNFPHQCTMNFRYMVPTVLYPAMALGISEQTKRSRITWLLDVYMVVAILTIIVWCIAV